MASAKKAAAKKTASKPAAKKAAPAKGASAKGASAKGASAARGIKRPKLADKPIAGFVQSPNGLFIPTALAKPVVVPSNKLREGLEAAQSQIKRTLQGLAAVFTQEFEVSEMALTLSFNADGKFLGFGVGGAMSVSIKIVPSQEDDS